MTSHITCPGCVDAEKDIRHREDVIRDLQRESRSFFEQSCENLRRAEAAEAHVARLVAERDEARKLCGFYDLQAQRMMRERDAVERKFDRCFDAHNKCIKERDDALSRERAMREALVRVQMFGGLPGSEAMFVDAALADPSHAAETPAEHLRRCGPTCEHVMACPACGQRFGLCDKHEDNPDETWTWKAYQVAEGQRQEPESKTTVSQKASVSPAQEPVMIGPKSSEGERGADHRGTSTAEALRHHRLILEEHHLEAIAAARAEEREACAKVADEFALGNGRYVTDRMLAARDIAAAIREGAK